MDVSFQKFKFPFSFLLFFFNQMESFSKKVNIKWQQ